MEKAARVIVDGRSFRCDVGGFNENIFVYIAAFGLFTDVSYETRQDMKNVLGHMAYVLEGMRKLSKVKSYALKVTSGDRAIEGDFIFGMITNSLSVGGFKKITGDNVKLDDGVFEVTLIRRPGNPVELNTIMAAMVNRNIDTDLMECFTASELQIESAEDIAWTLDGEFGGRHSRVEIQNYKQALEIRVPGEE